MFTAQFKSATRISNQASLRAVFDTDSIWMEENTQIVFSGSIALGHGVSFSGSCIIGNDTIIGASSSLTNVKFGSGNEVRPNSILADVDAGANNLFGPFCFIRDGCSVADDCILGAHVEATRSEFGTGTKISHRAFVGDAVIEPGVIIGAGVVFCNWDGQRRQTTLVGAGAVVGSGSLLVPPLSLGQHAVIAAGCTITKDVPANSKIIQKRT